MDPWWVNKIPTTGIVFYEREFFSPAESKKKASDIIVSLLETTTHICMEWLKKRKQEEKRRERRKKEEREGRKRDQRRTRKSVKYILFYPYLICFNHYNSHYTLDSWAHEYHILNTVIKLHMFRSIDWYKKQNYNQAILYSIKLGLFYLKNWLTL